MTALTADLLLHAYAAGIFPMAQSRDDPAIFWVDPRRRGVIPLDAFHVSRSLRRRILRGGYEVRIDSAFAETLDACAARPDTWISAPIRAIYLELHRGGHAHSLEIWQEGALAGGVYGVRLGAAFFGESMFSHRTDASKLALAHLVHRLKAGGFRLFDTQFLTDHLASLGGIEIARAAYRRALAEAVSLPATFAPPGYCPDPSSVARQPSSQTS